ncbi:MAG: prepilin-type N-terminal cleavage/methylation domain-containing protein [Proteobacteria bacterium]|nr:prepilin-type N-terminal cleavage/methylation domain-containing protein [Pseudomonadota bacterium]MBU1581934.1 prepilin-type N-terminal cleavage/methylation domain-containing protein [Pseudomonadota bacterium]MBU2452092.1 prepilin-type N-terminal cleavage/methylation domain-containing protein [Pseudomonadota bacterium]
MLSLKQFKNERSANNKGFTLIEIAVVLVIIGLIIGAAVKGKDLIQSGKQKKFYTNSLKAWELVVVSYYDRTGFALGDGTVNGGSAGVTDGRFDNVRGSAFTNIDARLKAVGLTVPTSNTANSGQFSFKGQYSGTQTITLNLWYLRSNTDARNNNAFYLQNVPTDLAIALDTMVDGQANSSSGTFRQYPDNTSATGAWPDASVTTVVNAQYILDVP